MLIALGHELQHKYVWAKPGHNKLDAVSGDDFFKLIEEWSEKTEKERDPIYYDDYKAAKEYDVYGK